MWKFKNNNNITETAKERCCVITDHQIGNWIYSGDMSLRDEPRTGHSLDLDEKAL